MKTLRICGHSHLAALQEGYRAQEKPELDVKFVALSGANYSPEDFSRVEPEGVAFTPELYRKNFADRTGETHINGEHLWGFSMGGYPFRLDAGAQWQRCRPSNLPEAGKRPVSLALIDAVIEADRKATQNFALHLKAAGARFFFIALPGAIRGFHKNDSERDIETRAFLQNRARRQFQEWLAEHSIDFVDVPDGLMDKDGFMDPDYMRLIKPNGAKDFNHGNEKFGKLMIEKISNYVNSRID
ncbi:MAG: hypothetical protein GQ535_15895 [Rhodobacteraceae bacterium]|nr:hypothetical protein [Paracoccaceae bacterium]